ncbi:MAG: UDP-N-acetylmuramate--L-alanine ligase [Candidatus Omnitrophota bacterium]|nr:UDP-N-acetylmuramate--L-alanine ligase [Candidatus Omnitrophota bacterium]
MMEQEHYHLIGIGGIGMSSIARLILRGNAQVSGSDIRETAITLELQKLGARIFIGHRPENVHGAATVIYSSAIKEGNSELEEARRQNLRLLRRAQALAELMRDKTVITVTGSHGKTTTTSLASFLLLEAGLSPTVSIGGILKNIDANACLGEGEFFVAEADESDGSFLYYRPKYSIITNLDREHLDYYQTFENEISAFRKFLSRTVEGGCAFCCADDFNLKNILKGYKKKYVLFGLKPDADVYPKNIRIKGLSSEFDCYCRDKLIGRFRLSLGGEHNISNAMAVVALGLELGIDISHIKIALRNYRGSRRRLEVKFSGKSNTIIDDYAHHPTEIKAALSAVKNLSPRRIIAVFQPHRYSRTKLLLEEFSRSFNLADCLVLADIYPASEPPIAGLSSKNLLDKIREYAPEKEVILLPKEQIAGHVLSILKDADLVIILGAGDIVKVSDELVERLKTKVTIQ